MTNGFYITVFDLICMILGVSVSKFVFMSKDIAVELSWVEWQTETWKFDLIAFDYCINDVNIWSDLICNFFLCFWKWFGLHLTSNLNTDFCIWTELNDRMNQENLIWIIWLWFQTLKYLNWYYLTFFSFWIFDLKGSEFLFIIRIIWFELICKTLGDL